MAERVQVVWWARWVGFGLVRDDGALGRVYRWRLRLGFFEVRRWGSIDG